MAFDYLSNVSAEQAGAEYIEHLKSRGLAPKAETVSVKDSCGRVSKTAVYAKICSPHYHASAMDGIAVTASDTFGAGETTPIMLSETDFDWVDTGDPIPQGRDAVIMIEDVVKNPDGSVKLYAAAAPWQHIRQIGEDICAGEMILPGTTRISPSAIGAMIAGGVTRVEVIKKPLVGIIPTGDEIVPPCEDPKPGEILEFNSSIFAAMVEQWGAEPKVYPIVPDDREKLKAAVAEAANDCDMVILNAGSSAGRDDYSVRIIRELGEVLYHGIAMKPGKPAILGNIGAKPVLGVPGYPVSGIIVVEQFLRPLIEYCAMANGTENEYVTARLTRAVVSGLKYKELVRVRMGAVGGKLIASPLNRGAGVVSSFMKADGIMEVPQGTEGFESGETVKVKLLRPKEELYGSAMCIGSHDPLLDELADMLHSAYPNEFLSSSHVGSMGGIMAVRRGEAHLGGIHLLDESDGSYNLSYLKKYFPNGGVYLVECVGRTQGIMCTASNPKGIKSIEDLFRGDISYVNRQKGSGTRILFDYLCKKAGLDGRSVYGYEREELTHTSVAAQIASGSGDAGMGIYSAAKLYDLCFVPICTEQYDLLIPEHAWDSPYIRHIIEILKSEKFKNRLTEMGGYTLNNPGEVRYRL